MCLAYSSIQKNTQAIQPIRPMVLDPKAELLSCCFSGDVGIQAGDDAEGQLVPEAANPGGHTKQVALSQLLEGLLQDAVMYCKGQGAEG